MSDERELIGIALAYEADSTYDLILALEESVSKSNRRIQLELALGSIVSGGSRELISVNSRLVDPAIDHSIAESHLAAARAKFDSLCEAVTDYLPPQYKASQLEIVDL
jgi:hypothetical protein